MAIQFPDFNKFDLNDKGLIQQFAARFKPQFCEYNFANLFCWQNPSKLSWTIYQDRLLIYDNIDKCAFMPLGKNISVKELVNLSLDMRERGLKPNFSLVTKEYIESLPEIEKYYTITKERDHAEYIYGIAKLCDLNGRKLSKKRNLISQFKRSYPLFEIHPISDKIKKKSFLLASRLIGKYRSCPGTLKQELKALKTAFECYEELGLEGIAILVENRVIAFSVFSAQNHSTWDIMFEKADVQYKGASQIINHGTAQYLKTQKQCQYLNREQDLGIIGLRQAKMSYVPEKLIMPYTLTLNL